MNKNQKPKTNVGADDPVCPFYEGVTRKCLLGVCNTPLHHGITLIALIITIIVLLILAGVAISLTVDQDNLFDKADQASIETNIGTIEEALSLHLLLEQKTIDEIEGLAQPLSLETPFADVYVIKDLSKIGVKAGAGKGTIPETNIISNINELKDVFVIDKNKVSYVDKDGILHGEINIIEKVEGTSAEWEVSGTTITKYLGDKTTYTDIVIPNCVDGKRVDTIGNGLFADDTYAQTLTISEGIKVIGNGAFSGCINIAGNLVIPNSVTVIGGATFGGCRSLTGDLIIPNGVTSIIGSTFSGCSGLTGDLVIPNSVTTLGSSVFGGTNFKNLEIDLTNIPDDCFTGCYFTGKLTLGEHVETIGRSAFQSCTKCTGDLIIPDNVKTIGYNAFTNCGFTGTLTLEKCLETIETSAFWNCKNLTGDLIIPSSVNKIGMDAFDQCGFNGDLIIPNGVTGISGSAFSELNLKNFKVDLEEITYSVIASQGPNFTGTLTIGEHVKTIGNRAFQYSGNKFTGDLIIPSNVTSIGESAFSGCTEFNSITIPNTVTSIGQDAFYGVKQIFYNGSATGSPWGAEKVN